MKKILLSVISLFIIGLIIGNLKSPSVLHLKTSLQTYIKCILLTNKVKHIQNLHTENSNVQLLKIPTNSSVNQILELLIQANIITVDNKDTLFCYMKHTNKIPHLKAGFFIIQPNLPYTALATKLTNPEQAEISITIPEGMRYDQIAKMLSVNLATKNSFSKFNKKQFESLVTKPPKTLKEQFTFLANASTLEGFLFPDTYSFNKFTTTTTQIVYTMLKNFEHKALPELQKKQKIYNLSPYKKLILASILERETNNNDRERQMVADILLKRLNINMALQVDATLLYPKRDWTYNLTYKDINTDNPYNTYTRTGLPPTPICNPGLSAIKAINRPIPNNYWYYMHDKLGNIHYAKTYSEHLANVNKYIR